MNGTSSARAFFEHVKSRPDPFAYLSSLPDPSAEHYPYFEEEWLDFKGCPLNDENAREIWSKALSGFSNTTDGVIVWGVDARKHPPRDIDAACGLRLINDPPAFESKLRDWIRNATNPPVLGVEYQSFVDETGEGFVVCLVPESSHKPHRAEYSKKQYYFRAGDDFLPAEPGLLRTLFYPHRSCQLEFLLEAEHSLERKSGTPFNDPEVISCLSAKLTFSGSMTARDLHVRMRFEPINVIHPVRGPDWEFRRNLEEAVLSLGAVRAFHPGEEIVLLQRSTLTGLGKLGRTSALDESQRVPAMKQWYIINISELFIRFEVYMADQQPLVRRFRFPSHQTLPGDPAYRTLAIEVV